MSYVDSYATPAEWTEYTGRTAPTDATLRLRRASRNVDEELIGAVYDYSDPYVSAALRDATIEQADSLRGSAYPGGLPSAYGDVAIGSVRLGGRSAASTGAAPGKVPFSQLARVILQTAGLTGMAVSTESSDPLGRVLL